jgi:hypothetical protein
MVWHKYTRNHNRHTYNYRSKIFSQSAVTVQRTSETGSTAMTNTRQHALKYLYISYPRVDYNREEKKLEPHPRLLRYEVPLALNCTTNLMWYTVSSLPWCVGVWC